MQIICCIYLDTLVSGSPIIQNGKLVGALGYHGNEAQLNANWHYDSCIGTIEHNFNEDNVCTECGKIDYTPGDIDGNGIINTTDLAVLKLYLVGTT